METKTIYFKNEAGIQKAKIGFDAFGEITHAPDIFTDDEKTKLKEGYTEATEAQFNKEQDAKVKALKKAVGDFVDDETIEFIVRGTDV